MAIRHLLFPLSTALVLSLACNTAPPEPLGRAAPRKQPVTYNGSIGIGGQEIRYTVRPAAPLQFPGEVDSNSPAYWRGDELVLFNSAGSPTRISGSALHALSDPRDVTDVERQRSGGWWIEAVWPDPDSGILYGWYHLEPDDLECLTAPFIGAAISFDHGDSWVDIGPVLDTDEAIDCSYDNGYFVGGHGDFSVLLDRHGEYFYFLYSNYSGAPEEHGVAVARSASADRGLPGTAFKFHDGAWEQPGLGGKADVLFPSSTGWAGPFVQAFWGPSVHWNEYLGLYVVLLNHTEGMEWQQEGVYIAFSEDLVQWSAPQKVMDVDMWYPQVMGLDPGGTDRVGGKSVRVFVGGISDVVLEFDMPGMQKAEEA